MTRNVSHALLLVTLLWIHETMASFTKPSRWPGTNLAIQQNSAGSWCFIPVSGETAALDCKGDHADLQGVLEAHLKQDLSIAYYNGVDNTRQGGASWSVPTGDAIIHACASGKSGDNVVQTICFTVNADNTFYGNPYCEVALGPTVVSDGCYSVGVSSSPSPFVPPPAPVVTSPQSTPVSIGQTEISNIPSESATNASQDTSKPTSVSATTALPTPTTINVITSSNDKKNIWTDIIVPIIVAISGVIAAAFSAKMCHNRHKGNPTMSGLCCC